MNLPHELFPKCLWACACIALACLAAPSATARGDGAGTYRVLLVGDSWAQFIWFDGSLRARFAAEGHPDVWEKGDVTAIGGSTAAEWAQPGRLQLVADELAANPPIDLLQLTIGGNDFLAGISGGGWHTGLSQVQEEALLDAIMADIETVLDFALGLDPTLEIVLSFYDYTNFVETLSGPLGGSCTSTWENLGSPTPLEINQAQIRFVDRAEAIVMARPRVRLVRHSGAMQAHFGYPAQGIAPGELTPPGDPTLPSPPEAMRFFGSDCFHLNPEGYDVLAANLWEGFYSDFFCIDGDQWRGELPSWPATIDVRGLATLINRLCP